jgi:hypothetical protein
MRESVRKIKTFGFLHWKYIVLVFDSRLEIYTSHKLHRVQTLEFVSGRVVNCYFVPSKHTLVVMLEKFLVCYGFTFTRFASVK